tara:strand:- start:63 stop:659 length:597 start_codon:yes stop_codon:yes gene_type:complete
MLQFVEVRDDKVIQHVNIDETILSTEEIQNICPSPHFIQVFKPLRNKAVLYDPITKTLKEDPDKIEEVKKDDNNLNRKIRDKLLKETDWTQTIDNAFSTEERVKYQIYRKDLRDITDSDQPYFVQWPDLDKPNREPFEILRMIRNERLKETDHIATLYFPHSNLEVQQTWFDYRQALRDLPSTTEDPANPVWPTAPTS